MATETMILLGIGMFVLLTLSVGLLASRKTHSATDFIVAGRHLPVWICSASIFATWFGSGIMMGATTSGYERDFLLMIGEPYASALCLFLSGLFFARIYRRTKRMTWIEFFEARYGRIAGLFGAVTDIAGGIIWLGGILFTFGVLLESLAGLPMAVGVLGGVLVVVVYTVVGGMWAVALTDVIQSVVLVVGLIILLVVVLVDIGGWSVIATQLPEHTIRFLPIEHTLKSWADYIHVWMSLGIAAIVANSIIQRALAARNEVATQNSFYLASLGYLVIGTIPLVLGFAASVTMPEVEDPNAVLADLAVAHLHPILVAIFVGAIVSAAMSTSDSVLLSVGSIISVNILPFFKKNADDGLRLRVARYSIPFTALAATYIAFRASRVVEVLIDSAAPALAMTLVPFVLCFWWEKANPYGALAGMAIGLLGWTAASMMETVVPPDLIAFGISLLVMVSVTLSTQRISPPRPLTDIDGNVVPLRDRLGFLRNSRT